MALLTPTSAIADTRLPPVGDARSVKNRGDLNDVDELRIALVCDGGVSLAIYEHGVTKELLNLVVASRLYDDRLSKVISTAEVDELPLTPLQRLYLEALQTQPEGLDHVTVVIDVISGTSAGGINGIFLAKAIAENLSLKPLTEMWFDHGDVKQLLEHKAFGRLRAVRGMDKHVGTPTWAPFNGTLMSQWVLGALNTMEESALRSSAGTPRRASLVPAGEGIDLFVETTDLRGFDRAIPSPGGTGDGDGDWDRVNRKAFHFSSTASEGKQFAVEGNSGLAFAARCTSSFPGAFPPSSLEFFAEAARAIGTEPSFDPASIIHEHLEEYRLDGMSPDAVDFSDGGILDNSPFDLMIGAIAAKPAENKVLRRVIHIKPDPREWEKPVNPPGHITYAGSILKALRVRDSQSLVGDLIQIQRMNDQIGQVAAITTALERNVDAYVKFDPGAVGDAEKWDRAMDRAPEVRARSIPVGTAQGAWSTETYDRLKVNAIGQMMAADLATALKYPADTQQAECLRVMFATWSRTELCEDPPGGDLHPFLKADMPYQERRLRFLIDRLNQKYGATKQRTELNVIKAAVWTVLRSLMEFRTTTAAMIAEGAPFVQRDTLTLAESARPDQYAERYADEFHELTTEYRDALAEIDIVAQLTSELGKEHLETELFDDVIKDFLWFPVWDAAVFPVIALSRLPQLTPISLTRFSPLDAVRLTGWGQPGKPHKLQGTRMANFGGFLDREWRENDYLWGRLDAAELILRQLGKTTRPQLKPFFEAILNEVEPETTKLGTLIGEIRAELAQSAWH